MLQSFTGSTDRLVAAAQRMKPETSSVETIGEQQEEGDTAAAFASAMGRTPSAKGAGIDQILLAHGQDEVRVAGITLEASFYGAFLSDSTFPKVLPLR